MPPATPRNTPQHEGPTPAEAAAIGVYMRDQGGDAPAISAVMVATGWTAHESSGWILDNRGWLRPYAALLTSFEALCQLSGWTYDEGTAWMVANEQWLDKISAALEFTGSLELAGQAAALRSRVRSDRLKRRVDDYLAELASLESTLGELPTSARAELLARHGLRPSAEADGELVLADDTAAA